MNDSDRALLQDFLTKLKSARLPEKDPEAARLIDEAFQVQPDAPVLLVIRCLLQQRALDELRAQIEALQHQLAQAQAGQGAAASTQDRGWFSRLMGTPAHRPAPAPAPPPVTYAAPPPAYGAPAYGSYGSAPGGSLLGSIATTAAGVAAGEFLFSGIEHMLGGGHGYGYGYGPGGFGGVEQPVVENVTINEFGGQPQQGFEGGRGFENTGFDNAGYQNVDQNLDQNFDDSGNFDGGGFDDSFDGGGDSSI